MARDPTPRAYIDGSTAVKQSRLAYSMMTIGQGPYGPRPYGWRTTTMENGRGRRDSSLLRQHARADTVGRHANGTGPDRTGYIISSVKELAGGINGKASGVESWRMVSRWP